MPTWRYSRAERTARVPRLAVQLPCHGLTAAPDRWQATGVGARLPRVWAGSCRAARRRCRGLRSCAASTIALAGRRGRELGERGSERIMALFTGQEVVRLVGGTVIAGAERLARVRI